MTKKDEVQVTDFYEDMGVGILIKKGLTVEQWGEVVAHLVDIGGWLNFARGDAIVYSEQNFGEESSQFLGLFAHDHGGVIEASTIAMYAYVARRIPIENRVKGVPWSYHKEVAPLSTELQLKYLKMARDKETVEVDGKQVKVTSVAKLRSVIAYDGNKMDRQKSTSDDSPEVPPLGYDSDEKYELEQANARLEQRLRESDHEREALLTQIDQMRDEIKDLRDTNPVFQRSFSLHPNNELAALAHAAIELAAENEDLLKANEALHRKVSSLQMATDDANVTTW